ncbi:hypothetical protein EIP91_007577 [Steccherinum ochraceum]|uniref:Uncharacterized protein n=1 Tax=Steccherinum ochraceum TaxID=92696 RepID=A0A4R0RLM1_9APHY|nr:hypothetical protein EIP91_007577 [Steccherinum ochraceum]
MVGNATQHPLSPTSPTDAHFASIRPPAELQADAYGHIPIDGPVTLLRCIITAPYSGGLPTMWNANVSSSTRAPIDAERRASVDKQLRWLTCLDTLIPLAQDKLLAKLDQYQLLDRKLDPNDPRDASVLHAIHPFRTAHGLPPTLYSEADSTSHINARFIWPAIHLLRLLLVEMKRSDAPMAFESYTTSAKDLFVSSSEGQRKGHNAENIPDGILRYMLRNLAVLEWKTENALKTHDFNDLIQRLVAHAASHQSDSGIVPARVEWGRSTQSVSESRTKIIFQVWSQMRWRDCGADEQLQFACLSSLQATYFFYRPSEHQGAMFISQPLNIVDATVLKFAAFFALAIGLTKLDEQDIPSMNTAYMNEFDGLYRHIPSRPIGVDYV